MIEWIRIWGQTIFTIVATITAIIGFIKLFLEMQKLVLEIRSLKAKFEKSESLIKIATLEEIEKYSIKRLKDSILSEINSRQLTLADLLLKNSIEDIKIQLSMLLAMLEVGGDRSKELLDAYTDLEKSAGEKNLKLDYEIITHTIGFKEEVSNGKESLTVQMCGESLFEYINTLNDLIRTNLVDKHCISAISEQLAACIQLKHIEGMQDEGELMFIQLKQRLTSASDATIMEIK